MYGFLARFSHRFKWWVTAFWVLVAALLFLVAPKLSEVGVTDQSQFLPQDTESATAASLLHSRFSAADQPAPSSGLIVFFDAKGLSQTQMAQAQQLRDWLASSSAPNIITSVVSPFDADALKARLISPDGTTLLISLDFNVPALDPAATQAIASIRDYIHTNCTASQVYFSGDAGLLHDLFSSVQKTIARTTLVTIVLVTILLLIVYRSPVAALLPLITIGASYLVASGLLGYLAQAGMKVSTLAEAYLVVIIFGVGTDYCLFIVSRFREELARSHRAEAQMTAMRQIGPVIAASALTVIIAFLALGISRFGMNQTTGYAMALGVAITLLAGLTLTPALMSVFGHYVFWPAHKQAPARPGRFSWQSIGRFISRHPAYIALPIILLLAVPYAAISRITLSAGVASQMPASAEALAGFNTFAAHFPGGEFSPLYLMIELPQGQVFGQDNLSQIKGVASALARVPGVARVDYFAAPADALAGMAAGLGAIQAQLAQGKLPDDSAASLLASAGTLLQSLPLQYPGILQSQNFTLAAGALGQIQAISAKLPATPPAGIPALAAQLQTAFSSLAGGLTGLGSEFALKGSGPFVDYLTATYFSGDDSIARINVVLQGDPYAASATDTVALLRAAARTSMASSTISGARYFLGGEAATRADILAINDNDFGRVTVITVIGVLAVIVLLLRSLLAPLYMVLTVLFNYGATLGIAAWLFLDLMKKDSLIYMIPLFVFVILIALGADYNIFLMSRIREEMHKHPVREAVANAVGGTGGVITACGIILAGTFATLMTSSLQVVLQIGAVITIGILLDTFLVRALLVPSIAVMAGKWGWWPSGLFFELRKKGSTETPPKAAKEVGDGGRNQPGTGDT